MKDDDDNPFSESSSSPQTTELDADSWGSRKSDYAFWAFCAVIDAFAFWAMRPWKKVKDEG